MRLFLAIEMPDRVAVALEGLQRGLPEVARRVDAGAFHLTLAFLGDASETMAEELDLALDGMRMPLPEISLAGLGVFGSRAPRAIWIGAGPEGALRALQTRLAGKARGAGFDLPHRRFVPHVTLARFREGSLAGEAVARFIEGKGRVALPPFRPHAVTLFRSHLRPEGPLYEALADYPVTPDQTT
jgi:2'-5' RNA ligase